MKVVDPFALFKFHGVNVSEVKGNHGIANCPFCHKENHFFINSDNLCWDCKICLESGNEYGFINRIHEKVTSKFTYANYQALALERKLPVEAFISYDIGFFNRKYYLPYYNEFSKINNLGVYVPGKKLFKTPRLELVIFNLEKLYHIDNQDVPIYLCEGEWDAIALEYVLNKIGEKGVCLGLPSAGTFKLSWIDYFHGKTVYIVYDNDETGFKGQIKVSEYIGEIVKEIKYIHWPKDYAKGYDIRDLVQAGLSVDLDYTYYKLHSFLSPEHPLDKRSDDLKKKITTEPTGIETVVEYAEVIKEFKKYLDVDEDFEDAIKITLACAISPKIPGKNPLWIFLVGPPGCGKTEILTSLREAKTYTEFQSTISSTALISGWIGKKGTAFDPSLIPKLNNKCLVLKDFTEILQKNPLEKDTIFSILRGAYDGHCERMFGQGTKREYNSKFAIVAGVTREIYASSTANVGERFLKYNMRPDNTTINKHKRQKMAMEADLFGEESRLSVVETVNKFLENTFDTDPNYLRSLIPEWFLDRIIALADLIALLRTQVIRYEKGQLQYEPVYKPQSEDPNRLSSQFQRLGLSLALIENKKIDEAVYDLIKKVAIYTVHDYTITIFKSLVEQENSVTLREMEDITKLSYTTLKMYVEDMRLLDMLDKHILVSEGKNVVKYSIKNSIKQMFVDSQLCTTNRLLQRIGD